MLTSSVISLSTQRECIDRAVTHVHAAIKEVQEAMVVSEADSEKDRFDHYRRDLEGKQRGLETLSRLILADITYHQLTPEERNRVTEITYIEVTKEGAISVVSFTPRPLNHPLHQSSHMRALPYHPSFPDLAVRYVKEKPSHA